MNEKKHEIIGILFISFSILLITGYFISSESLLRTFVLYISNYIGAGVFIFSLMLWLKGMECFGVYRSYDKVLETMGWLFLFIFFMTTANDLNSSGGILGLNLSNAISYWFGGNIGKFIMQLSFLIISMILIFNISIQKIFLEIVIYIKKLKLKIIEYLEQIKEKRISNETKDIIEIPEIKSKENSFNKKEVSDQVEETMFIGENNEEYNKVSLVPVKENIKDIVKIDNKLDDEIDVIKDNINNEIVEKTKNIKDVHENEKIIEDEKVCENEEIIDDIELEIENDQDTSDYILPTAELLNKINEKDDDQDMTSFEESGRQLISTLKEYGVEAKLTEIVKGPRVSRFEFTIKAGTKISKVAGLSQEISMALKARSVRIEAPIPGKSSIGVEIPNKIPQNVYFRQNIESDEFTDSKTLIPMALGKDVTGSVVVGKLEKMPHLLVAGTTGSGKSVCINVIINSILFRSKPDEVKFIMVDPKVVELSLYNDLPHLLTPVITDPQKAAATLQWAVEEMELRYRTLANVHLRDIASYNKMIKKCENNNSDSLELMPYIVIIIDELADLMMVAKSEVEDSIIRIAQKARAVGIHLIVATQRPSVDVVTGLIKANLPSRIAFTVRSGMDSRTILDSVGAEKLLGQGDMLYFPTGVTNPIRIQNAYIDTDEVKRVLEFIKNQKSAEYFEEVEKFIEEAPKAGDIEVSDKDDPLLKEAMKLVVENNNPSVSMLQRKLSIGHSRAGRLMDIMEEKGIVTPMKGNRREILISVETLQEII